MKAVVTVDVNPKYARTALELAGYDVREKSDEEICKMAIQMNDCYAVKTEQISIEKPIDNDKKEDETEIATKIPNKKIHRLTNDITNAFFSGTPLPEKHGKDKPATQKESFIKSGAMSCVTGATLLSIEEARQLNKNILITKKNPDKYWYLRSPASYNHGAVYVHSGDFGQIDTNVTLGVRPALKIKNPESFGLWIGDSFAFGDYRFTIISAKYALCDEIVGECHFKSNGQNSEATNDYETSDIKKFVDYWYEQELCVEKNLFEEDYEL